MGTFWRMLFQIEHYEFDILAYCANRNIRYSKGLDVQYAIRLAQWYFHANIVHIAKRDAVCSIMYLIEEKLLATLQ
jgi:hypothetical protein